MELMFPKEKRKKRRKEHKKSILHNKADRTCFLCMELDKNFNTHNCLHEHHVFRGVNRGASEAEGMKVYLCVQHHTVGPEAVHNNKDINLKLKQIAQREYEKTHTREEFREKFKQDNLSL